MKHIVRFIALIGCMLAVCWAQPSRPKVAVVLSGGGAKGVAHISVLRAIEEAGIPVDIVCGTSMGALVGGLYSVGWTPDEIDTLVRTQNWGQLLSDRVPPSLLTLDQRRRNNTYTVLRTAQLGSGKMLDGGAIRGYNLERLFRHVYAGYEGDIDFGQLPIPFACVATDLVSGTEVDLTHGDLKQALRASMAIPGVFTPVRMGDMLLVDGGLMNNFPVDIARRMGADVVIGVSVQNQEPTIDEMNDALSVLMRVTDLSAMERYAANVSNLDLMIQVNVDGYSAASFSTEAIDTLIARGQCAADEHRADLVQLRRAWGIDSVARPASLHRHPRSQAHTDEQGSYREGITVGLGLRFDTEELGAILVGFHLPLGQHVPVAADIHLRLGQTLRAGLTFSSPRMPYPSVEYNFFRRDMDLYYRGDRILNTRYVQHQASVYPLRAKLRSYDMMMGMRWDYYNYYSGVLTSFDNSITTDHDNFFSYRIDLSHNTENDWNFPTRGLRTHLVASYVTDNLVGFGADPGLLDIMGNWRINFAIGSRMAVQPMVYGRVLVGDEVPMVLSNVVRGQWFGHTIEQLQPFPGVANVELLQRDFFAAQMQLQYRLGQSHYVQLRGAMATSMPGFENADDAVSRVGVDVGYAYRSLFGPIEMRLGYSNFTSRLTVFVSLGHEF